MMRDKVLLAASSTGWEFGIPDPTIPINYGQI
jgi:hypothetical protein